MSVARMFGVASQRVTHWVDFAARRLPPWRSASQNTLVPSAPFAATRRRLVIMNVLFVMLILAIIGAAAYLFDSYTSSQHVDQQLTSYADHESFGLLGKINGPDAAQQNTDQDATYSPSSPNLFAVTLDTQGHILLDEDHVSKQGLPSLSAARPVLDGHTRGAFSTVRIGEQVYRLYSIPVLDEHGRLVAVLQAGVSLEQLHEQLHDVLIALLITSVGVLALTLVSSLLLTERALVPASQAFARQRQFAAAASHELRTPLAVVRSQVDLLDGLLRDCVTDIQTPQPRVAALKTRLNDLIEEAGEVSVEVDYMTRLVGDLLVLARDEHDQRALSLQLVDLRAIVVDTVNKVTPLAQAKQLQLTTSAHAQAHADTSLLVIGDADRLRQLVLILLDNAVRYTPDNGRIHVELREESRRRIHGERGGKVSLIVRDTGVGIPAEDQAHIFEPFYRATLSHPSHKSADGTGLGLAIAQWIAHAHNGAINVHSEPDKGTVFTVTLPLADERS